MCNYNKEFNGITEDNKNYPDPVKIPESASPFCRDSLVRGAPPTLPAQGGRIYKTIVQNSF